MTASFVKSAKLIESMAGSRDRFCILDARAQQDFLAGHIPGAGQISWDKLCATPPSDCHSLLEEPGYWGLLAELSSRQWNERLSGLGLNCTKSIVVYGDGPLSWGMEGRIAWMLLYLGATDVLILDGGWRSWVSAGGQIEYERGNCNGPSHLSVAAVNHRRARIDDLFSLLNQDRLPLLVDTRSQSEFDGEALDYYERNGRMPGSILFPFEQLFDSAGCFITRDQYLRTVPPEILSAQSLVAYCEVGVRASTFALLHERYTGHTVPVYDGSIVEWAHYRSLPVLCS